MNGMRPASEGRAAPWEAFRSQRTFGALDGLRALSILAVLWHHTWEIPTGWWATERGFLGVDLFFVISGFLIVTLLLRERDRSGDVNLRHFYVRRFLRIFPVYYGLLGALALVFGLAALAGHRTSTGESFFDSLPWALTYLSNWVVPTSLLSITWSLAAEEQFYLVWPPLERWVRGAVIPILLLLLGANIAIQLGAMDSLWAAWGFVDDKPAMLRQTGFTPIMLGVLLAHGLHHQRSFAILAKVLRPSAAVVVALLAIVGVCSLPMTDIGGWPRLVIHLLMTILVGAAVIREDHPLMPALRVRPLVLWGTLSYGLYLFHMPCRMAVDGVLGAVGVEAPWPLPVLTLALTTGVAWCTFHFFETRFLRLKHRFSGGAPSSTTTTIPGHS